MNDCIDHSLGARPLSDMEWQMGKTATAIKFVKDGEAYLLSLPQAKFSFDIEQTHEALRIYCAGLKSGEKILNEWLSVSEFLAGDHLKE